MEKQSILLIFFITYSLPATTITNAELSNLGVVFDLPITTTKRSPYALNKLMPLISKVASNFSKIMSVHFVQEMKNDSSLANITIAVAAYNKFLRKDGETPLELSIKLLLEDIGNVSAPAPILVFAQQKADEANAMFRGTVRKIYLAHSSMLMDTFDTKDGKAKLFAYYLSHVNFLNNSNYEIIPSLTFDACKSNGFSKAFRHFRRISLDWFPYSEGPLVPQAIFTLILRDLSIFQSNARKYNENIQVEIEARWLESNETDKDTNDKNLVLFWDILNEWSRRKNKTVFLNQAFDDQKSGKEKFGEFERAGWWRLVENVTYNHSSQYVFEDKRPRHFNPRVESESSSSTWTFLIAIVVMIFIVAIIIVVVALIRYFRPDLFYTYLAPLITCLKRI